MISQFFTPEIVIAYAILTVLTARPTYVVYLLARKRQAARPIPHFPYGVRGWLLIFVATVVLSIILTALDAANVANHMRQTTGTINWSFISPYIVVCGLYISGLAAALELLFQRNGCQRRDHPLKHLCGHLDLLLSL